MPKNYIANCFYMTNFRWLVFIFACVKLLSGLIEFAICYEILKSSDFRNICITRVQQTCWKSKRCWLLKSDGGRDMITWIA